ncbi:MATE efflux family protein ALF5-like isoform X1 [Gossypium australe]|uniref:MATE efflux family protein ALF5-like isoform X1 n=1 Tax=Gossypium australe TaxID=47621 RepID=A0A5B6X0V7_9ROSI|nr:MATE efflux family protein ALF5-like isoform X1 [Gossypium australe]
MLQGVARGLGWQHMVVVVNLASYYVVGMPIAAIAGFKFKLYAKGLWIGLICGLLTQGAILLLITFHRRWSRIDISAERDEENSVD